MIFLNFRERGKLFNHMYVSSSEGVEKWEIAKMQLEY